MAKKKSWREKLLASKDLPKVEPIPEKMRAKFGDGTIVIPAPVEVDAIMKEVPKGKLLTINEIRTRLAKNHNATIACPMTTGIFAWIAAHAAEEAHAQDETDITPYWRTLKASGELNAKYPGGITHLQTLLESEGHKVVQKGKKFVVEDFEKSLWN